MSTRAEPLPTRPALPPPVRRCPTLLVLGLFVVAIGGRYTLDRTGITRFGELDLRLVGCAGLAVAVVLWHLHPRWVGLRRPPATSLRWALALVGWIALSAFWAPAGARTGESLTDLAVLATLILLTAVVVAPDPDGALRVLLGASLASGTLYAVVGLVFGGQDVQGRLTAFGGGPNVFARVVFLGIVAAVALTVIHRRWWLLVPVPVMGAAGFLAGSRGAVAAAVLTLLAFLVVFRSRWTVRGTSVAVAVAAVGAVLAVVSLGPALDDVIRVRFLGVLQPGSDLSGRPELLEQAWRLFADHPVVGSGLDSFWATYGINVALDYPHNIVADVAGTAGLAGLGLFAAFGVVATRDIRRWSPLGTERLAIVLAAVFVLAASMFSGDLYDSRFFWILIVAAATRTSYGRAPHDRHHRLDHTRA